jgi:hypothetical protein
VNLPTFSLSLSLPLPSSLPLFLPSSLSHLSIFAYLKEIGQESMELEIG